MEFSERLMILRKQAGLFQEQLADRLGVTRQSVSKWESGTALPELVKLISLSEIFGVSLDYLVKDYIEEPESAGEIGTDTVRLEQKVDDLTRYVKGSIYSYDSKIRIWGLPLVSIRLGFVRNQRLSWENVARGVFAIGNAAIGVVSLGLVSMGLLSFGCITLGLLALGVIAMGVASLGVVALGASSLASVPWACMPAASALWEERSLWAWRPPPGRQRWAVMPMPPMSSSGAAA